MSFFSKNEILVLLIASLMTGYLLAFKQITWTSWLACSGIGLLIVLIHHAGYKFSASLLDCSTETQLWSAKQLLFTPRAHLKKQFPLWLFIPLVLVWLSIGAIKWLGIITFNVVPLPSRIKMRWKELTEWHIALIAAGSSVFNIIAAIAAKALGFNSFAIFNLMFVLFSLIPIGQLDGSKIFFGSRLLWIFMSALSLIMLLLIQAASITYTIIAAVIIALFALVVFYFFYEAA